MRNSRAIIHLNNLVENIRVIRDFIGGDTSICLAVKANGYGHGAVEIARAAVGAGVRYLAVATADEGLELRKAGISAPVLLLGIPLPEEVARIVSGRISCVVTDEALASRYAVAARQTGVTARLHLMIDTGMGRIGCTEETAPGLAASISQTAGVFLEGVCTHFPVADDENRSYTVDQIGRFLRCVARVRASGIDPGIVHAANSAGLEAYPESWFDMIRTGIAAYGYVQAPKTASGLKLKPVMELQSTIVFLKKVQAGTPLSYGHTHVTGNETQIATVAVGYADGYRRALSNRGQVLINGNRYPVVGTVCMDQILVDVGPNPKIALYDTVTLFGPDRAGPDAAEIADLANTIPYEITCGINGRTQRDYMRVADESNPAPFPSRGK